MIISLPKHFHLYRDFVKVCSRLAFGAYMYVVMIKIVFSKAHHNQRTNGPVNAHLISWPSKAQNIQNLENIW